jgi:hypothetical protein
MRLRSRLDALADLTRAIRNDDLPLTESILGLSRSRRWLAPLALCIGAFAMLFDGLKLLLSNWRLLLIQVLPAILVWLAMYDLKAHVLHGASFRSIRGPILIPIGLAIVGVTIGCFFLNAVFAFAIAGPQPPRIRLAFTDARAHVKPVLVYGGVVGAMLAVATTVSPRWGSPWFALTLGVVVGVLMISYVAVPARLIGVRSQVSPRDKLTASFLSSAIGATVCTPPYLLSRLGILMLGSSILRAPGIVLLVIGAALQAGATGAVRAIKLGAALAVGRASTERTTAPDG